MPASRLIEKERDGLSVAPETADPGVKKDRGMRRRLLWRLLNPRKHDVAPPAENTVVAGESPNETAALPREPPPTLTKTESFLGKASVGAEALVSPSTGTGAHARKALASGVEDLDLPPILQAPPQAKGRPVLAVASTPIALVICMLLIRAAWYFYQHHQKRFAGEEKGTCHASVTTAGSNRHSELVKKPTRNREAERELKRTLEMEATAKLSLAQENQALRQALDMHKSSVDKFSSELQSRNDRLSGFEKEQESVHRQLSSQIEILKQELQGRQEQEQADLKDKESLCNGLIAKIKTLNHDLTNHEKLLQNVAQKAEHKEVESAAKVEALQITLKEEEQQRMAAFSAKKEACANLSTKLQALKARHSQQTAQNSALEQQMGFGAFRAAEEKLRARLREEQDHASSLTTKLQVFSAELLSRDERVSTLEAKMKDVEGLSDSDLKQLQRELQQRVVHRDKLQQTAVDMTRLLQEKQNQCVRLQNQWEASKAELKALDDRVQTLASEVAKRVSTAGERIESLRAQLVEERKHQGAFQRKSEMRNEELIKKQEEFIQLTTRMDLFLKELQFRDTQVASLESKLTAMEDLATNDIEDLQAQLQEATERRDTWTKTTDDLTHLMKDKKAQEVGLTTRADLFERELLDRKEIVEALEAKIKERKKAETVKLEPYRKDLHRFEEERDYWKEKTEVICRLLKQKIAQSEGLKARLKLFRIEGAKRSQRVSILRTTRENKEQSAELDLVPVREKLEKKCEQRDAWTTKVVSIDRALKEKRAQCVFLKTRLHLFGSELETREQVVAELEKNVAEKEAGDSTIARLRQKLNEIVSGRDEWKSSTEKVIKFLAEKKNEASESTAELKRLVSDLRNYQQRRAQFEAEILNQRSLLGGRHEVLEERLKAVREHRDTWAEKTKGISQAMKPTEHSIDGLETRLLLFKREFQQREEVLSKLQKKYWPMKRKISLKMEQLRGAIKAEKNLHEHGLDATVKLNKHLKDTKRECVGLLTRLELFSRELQKHKDLVSVQKKTIVDAESEASEILERMRSALSEQENACDEWTEKTEEVDRLQLENDEKIIGLGTRLELFMVQVMKEEDNVAHAENKLRSQQSVIPDPSLTREFDAAKEKLAGWTGKALDIERQLKARKSQVAGLKTRKMLFRLELEKREEKVSVLKSKLQQKEKTTAERLAPLKEALKESQRQHDDWMANLKGINKMLVEKQRQCLSISSRLEEVIDQLAQCTERSDNLKQHLKDEQSFSEGNLARQKINLDKQNKELGGWMKNMAEVNRLLQEKKQGIQGLKTRLHVFGEELRKRQEAVDGMKSKIEENKKSLAVELDLIYAQIQAEDLERDQIIEATLAQNQALTAMEYTCAATTVRLRLFKDELCYREEQATLLEAKLKGKECDQNAAMNRLKAELAARRFDLNKWKVLTESMDTLLMESETECVGLAIRSQLFTIEKEKHDQQVADLEDTITFKETDSAEKAAPIHDQLQQEQREMDSWEKKTGELDGMLQENKKEVIGLDTRSKLFMEELRKKEKGVAYLRAKLEAAEDEFAERIKLLVRESKTLQADRDAWAKSTQSVKNLLEKTTSELASILTRLNLFRREQETRAGAVAELEASISNKEDLVAVQLGFLLNELQLQQKQRGKWKKVALGTHRLLKETKDQVATLTTNLESCNGNIQKHQKQAMSLEAMLRETKGMTEQQLCTLESEVERQGEQRDNLRLSTTELNRLLGEAKEQRKDLSDKLSVSETQVEKCRNAVEALQAKVTEKKALDKSQIESIKAQLKIHVGQRAEWNDNTNQMKQHLKKKEVLRTCLKTKLALLKRLQSGDVRSSLSTDETDALRRIATSEIAAHLGRINQMTSNLGKKTAAEETLATKMDILEQELRKQKENGKLNHPTQQQEQGAKEKESECVDLTGQLTSTGNQYSPGAASFDCMLAEKEKKQSNLCSKLENLAGELLSL